MGKIDLFLKGAISYLPDVTEITIEYDFQQDSEPRICSGFWFQYLENFPVWLKSLQKLTKVRVILSNAFWRYSSAMYQRDLEMSLVKVKELTGVKAKLEGVWGDSDHQVYDPQQWLEARDVWFWEAEKDRFLDFSQAAVQLSVPQPPNWQLLWFL